jgi:outer membrane protein
MNGRRGWRTALLAAGGVLVWSPLAQAMEFPYLFSDPLRTLPDIVTKGVTLPGDPAPVPQTVQKDFSQPLSLGDAVDLALSNNQQVKGAWAEIKTEAAALGGAYATYLPTIKGTAGFTKDSITYSDTRYPSVNANRYTLQASATLRLFDFGGRGANRRSAENILVAAIASYNATIQDILTKVIQAYFDATTARASLTAKTDDEEIARNTLRSAQDREAGGTTSHSDTLRAATALAKASLDKNRAQGDYQKAMAVLRHYLGLPGKTEFILPPELSEAHGAADVTELDGWLEEAQKSHPAIMAARKQLEAAREQVTVARSAGMPTIDLAGNYYQNTRPGEAVSPGAREKTLMVALSVPFFDGFASTYKVRGAQADVEKKSAALADTEQQVAMNIIKAYADARSSLQNLEASATLLTSAKSALEVSQRKYSKGAADITEVLSTQSALADALNERVRCLAEWRSARLQLLASAGRMGRTPVSP